MQPILFTAWGPTPGHEYETTIQPLAKNAQLNGVRKIALQVGQAQPKHALQVHDQNMAVAGWGMLGAGAKAAIEALHPDELIVQVESSTQLDDAIACLKENPAPGIPRTVVTTLGGLDTPDGSAWKKLEALGVERCLVECYSGDGPPHNDVGRMLWQATRYGIPAELTFALLGTYRGETPDDYLGLDAQRARGVGLYLAEQMSAAQWSWWKTLLTAAEPQPTKQLLAYWDIVSGAATLHTERAVTYAPGDDGLGRALKWMADNKATLRTAKTATVKLTQR